MNDRTNTACWPLLALALSGCGAESDATQGDGAHGEIGSVTEALTTWDSLSYPDTYNIYDWDGVRATMHSNSNSNVAGGIGNVTVRIDNDNPARVHIRKLELALMCATHAGNTRPDIIIVDKVFSSYVDGNGGIWGVGTSCPMSFYQHLVQWNTHVEASFGD